MEKEVICPYCGCEVVTLNNKNTREYFCEACCSMFVAKKSVEIIDDKVENIVDVKPQKTSFDSMMNNVVEIKTLFNDKTFSGTGFFITKEYVLTNAHVVLGVFDEQINISGTPNQIIGCDYHKKNLYAFDLVFADMKNDIALIKSSIKSHNIAKLTTRFSLGEEVYAIGNSKGYGLCVVQGIISDTSRLLTNGIETIMTTALVKQGNSGGPLYNNKGVVIGMVQSVEQGEAGMSYVIPSKTIINFIKQIEKDEKIKITI